MAAKGAYAAALEADATYGKAKVNLERVSALVPEGGTPEVDVAHHAEEFRYLIRVWVDGQ